MQAKKLMQPIMTSEKNDEQYKRRLENLSASQYKSAASSVINHADTSQLEFFAKQIESEEYPQDTFFDSLLFRAKSLLETFGYASNIIESHSKKKIKNAKRSFQTAVSSLDEQIVQSHSTIDQLDSLISKYSYDMESFTEDVATKQKEYDELQSAIIDYRPIAKNSLDPKSSMFLEQGELDLDILAQQISDAKDTYDVVFREVQDYYAQKSEMINLKSIFEGERYVLNSLVDSFAVELDKLNVPNPIKIQSLVKSKITGAYKLKNELIGKNKRHVLLYNQKSSSIPCYKEMSDEILSKRKSLPRVNR